MRNRTIKKTDSPAVKEVKRCIADTLERMKRHKISAGQGRVEIMGYKLMLRVLKIGKKINS